MRYSALIAASLASNAFASPLHKRVYVTDIDLVTITKYVTATGPCPTTAETSTVAVTQEAVTSSQVVIVSTVSSAAPVVESSSEAPAPVETTSVAAPVTTSSALVEVSVSLAPSSTIVPETTVAPTTTAAPTTSAAPTTTATPTTTESSAAGGFSTYAFCPTSSVDATATLTAEPTSVAAKRWLAFHNAHRANHTDGCSMYWDYDLEAKAADSAATCVYNHTIDSTTNFGQNMGQMTIGLGGSITTQNLNEAPEFFTNMYYEEYNDFGPYWGASTVPTEGPNILHFTQMVWKGSYAVGCAVNSCDDMMLTFCNYRPRGNILDQYGDNVGLFIDTPHPPICSEIGSTATDGSCITDAELGL